MSENYEPKISVVRPNAMAPTQWVPEDGSITALPRALLVEGVPMVGARVNYMGDMGTVKGHGVHVAVQWDDTGEVNPIDVEDLHPAPSQEDREVEAVARAMCKANGDPVEDWGFWEDEARAAIEALDRVRGGGA